MKGFDALLGWFRWKRLLASCSYDPGEDSDLRDLGERDFLIVGCPRSGTSMLAAQLFRPPEVVTCMESWDGLRMPVHRLMQSLREEIGDGSLGRGRLDVVALRSSGAVRWVGEGDQQVALETHPGFALGVKWPAFWRYVPLLPNTRFLVCVRDPVEVITSFARIGGRLGEGIDYDVAFNREMNRELQHATDDVWVRRALMWEYINSRIVGHIDRQNVKVVRFERWFTEPDDLLGEIGNFLGVRLDGSSVRLAEPNAVTDPEVRQLVRDHCPTAALMGYGS